MSSFDGRIRGAGKTVCHLSWTNLSIRTMSSLTTTIIKTCFKRNFLGRGGALKTKGNVKSEIQLIMQITQ
jgi:hypothetical protein